MQMANMEFPYPYTNGHPIDTCVTTAGNPGECGKASADWWCRFMKCENAVSYAESTGDRGALLAPRACMSSCRRHTYDAPRLGPFNQISQFASTGPTWVPGDNVLRASGGNSFDLITCACSIPVQPAGDALPENQITYTDPAILGHPLDFCLHKGPCEDGKPAADAFCRSLGSRGSVRFEALNKVAGPTWVIGDGVLDETPKRHSFKSITCV